MTNLYLWEEIAQLEERVAQLQSQLISQQQELSARNRMNQNMNYRLYNLVQQVVTGIVAAEAKGIPLSEAPINIKINGKRHTTLLSAVYELNGMDAAESPAFRRGEEAAPWP